MLGISKSSPKTYTPGASKTCLINSVHAAPFADFAKSTNCSKGFAENEFFSTTISVNLMNTTHQQCNREFDVTNQKIINYFTVFYSTNEIMPPTRRQVESVILNSVICQKLFSWLCWMEGVCAILISGNYLPGNVNYLKN